MYEGIMEILLNGGPMALFAAYLVWSKNKQDIKLESITMQFFSRLDEMSAKHETLREALEEKYDNRNEQIRDRWLDVVKKAESERDETQRLLQQNINVLTSSVSNLREGIDKQSAEIVKLHDRLFQLSTTKTKISGD